MCMSTDIDGGLDIPESFHTPRCVCVFHLILLRFAPSRAKTHKTPDFHVMQWLYDPRDLLLTGPGGRERARQCILIASYSILI